MEQPIIAPIPKEVLLSELTPDRQLRMTNKSNNEIYIITAHNAPNVMREIGRLREMASARPVAERARIATSTSSTPARTATSS